MRALKTAFLLITLLIAAVCFSCRSADLNGGPEALRAGEFRINFSNHRATNESKRSDPEIIDPNEWLQKFPEKIPEAKSVEKHEVPDSRYVLVHIRQTHSISDELIKHGLRRSNYRATQSAIRKSREQINKLVAESQRNIYRIAYYLNNHLGVEEFYPEGLTQEERGKIIKRYYAYRQELENYEARIRMQRRRYVAVSYRRFGNSAEAEAYREAGNVIWRRREKVAAYDFVPGALLKLAYEGYITLLAAENKKVHSRALDILMEEYPGCFNEAQKARRMNLLRIIAGDERSYAVTSWGANHDFRDVIEEWNEANPEEKFSYIRITPNSYNRTRKRTYCSL